MRIVVMGAGAIGAYFGASLSRGGQDVTLVARGEHLRAISEHGLRVESASAGDFTLNIPALERPGHASDVDLVLFCVKSYDNEAAIETIRPVVGEATAILTLQNGIGGGDRLAEAFGVDKVLLGAAYIEAMRRAPGVVAQLGGPPSIVFGEPDGRETPRASRVRDALQRAGVDARLTSSVQSELWNKLIFICALSGMTCITRAPLSAVMETPETLDLTRRVLLEAEQVARAKGVDLDEDIVGSTMAHLMESRHDLVSSMYQDLQAGNPLELAVLNGAVSAEGKRAGVPTPVNDFISACLAMHADGSGQTRRGVSST